MAVAALVLPLLLLLDWLLVPVKWLDVRIFRNLSRAMVGMLFVMMASALHRMYLYQESFGLTELRLYTTAFMFWLALLFAWFLKTVSTGRRERFAFGGVILALVVALSLDLLNPDAVIVRINTAKGAAGNIDLRYLVSLSDDAVPALVDSLVGLNEYSRRYVVEQLTAADRKADWRSWNLGSHLAGAAVRDRIVPIARQPGTAPAGNP